MTDVYLKIYDMSKGLSKQLSKLLLGKTINGIWHTGVEAFGVEWYFGYNGISSCLSRGNIFGEPSEVLYFGSINLEKNEFLEIVAQMVQYKYKEGTYDLFKKNCNSFSNDLLMVLFSRPIPEYLTNLPAEIINTSLGSIIESLYERFIRK